MIPDFNEDGCLPPGIHLTTLDEFKQRFVYNSVRTSIFQGFLILIDDLKKVGCNEILIDGSYTTENARPGDMDVLWTPKLEQAYLNFVKLVSPVLLMTRYPRNEQKKRYKCDVLPSNVPADKNVLYIDFFQKDKHTGKPKGIIKIVIP